MTGPIHGRIRAHQDEREMRERPTRRVILAPGLSAKESNADYSSEATSAVAFESVGAPAGRLSRNRLRRARF
jgi:hypothetical protein